MSPAPNLVGMPKSAAYEIELGGDERAELEHRAACYTLSFRQVRRARLMLYAAEDHTNREIAQRLDMNEEVVGRWRPRFHAERLEGLEDRARSGRPRRSPPEQVAEVKAIACELPATHGLPLGRFTRGELHRLVVERGVTDASASTIWRWRHDDALKPWQQRSWIFVRDPAFRERAGRALDLYQRRFEGRRLRPDDLVICADEKSQLQALGRGHETVAARPGRSGPGRVRVPPARRAGRPWGLGRPPRQPVRPR